MTDYSKRLTPRDTVLDAEIAEEYLELFKVFPARWELYYSDGSAVFGETQEEWNAAPVDDVQILVWETMERVVHKVYGSDVYILGGITKLGKWMHDPTFFKMRDEVHFQSPIYKGEA